MYKNRAYFENIGPNWSKLGSFVDIKHHILHVIGSFVDKHHILHVIGSFVDKHHILHLIGSFVDKHHILHVIELISG